jgi:LDH2 family malate/lactate/ureidoglycolate dehydrogenase
VSATVIRRYRLDDLRRFAAALGCGGGLATSHALALASHLLWFDAVGAASFGIETLPCWLERIESRKVDLNALEKISAERPSVATIDGNNGIAPLVLERAAELAIEKARDTAISLVQVTRLGRLGSAAAIVAAMAARPVAGFVLGPGRLWSIAIPSPSGLPVLFDSALAGLTRVNPAASGAARRGRSSRPAQPRARRLSSFSRDGTPIWSDVLVAEDSWLVGAFAVAEFEPLSDFHDRVGRWLVGLAENPDGLLPASWTDRYNDAHERGVTVTPAVWKALKSWASRLAVPVPEPDEL